MKNKYYITIKANSGINWLRFCCVVMHSVYAFSPLFSMSCHDFVSSAYHYTVYRYQRSSMSDNALNNGRRYDVLVFFNNFFAINSSVKMSISKSVAVLFMLLTDFRLCSLYLNFLLLTYNTAACRLGLFLIFFLFVKSFLVQ